MKRRRSHSSRERETIQKAARGRVSRLLPLLILLGVALPASAVPAGVNVWTTNGPRGIDIRAVVVDPSNPATLYAGSYGNGVFKSTNAGRTWIDASAGLATRYINALAIEPAAPATLYAGTDGGIFKSTDAGGTWFAVNTGLGNRTVGALAIDPSNSATLYAGTWDGVFKSTNHGETWNAAGTGAGNYLLTLAIDPSRPATIYAGKFGPQVFKSVDAGRNWASTIGGPNDPWGYDSAPALAISRETPAAVYAGTSYGVFKTTDGGVGWTVSHIPGTQPDGPTDASVLALAIDPSNAATIYAGTWDAGVFKSTDGGATWSSMNAGLTNLRVNALAFDPSTPARIYAATAAGVYEFLAATGPCAPDSTTLCLNGGRFQITTHWTTRDGRSDAGHAAGLTQNAGYFTFFDPSNVEVLVKVLDGCGLNSRYWAFAAGLTDVNVVLTVTDTQTGTVQTYTNPQGSAFQPIQDTNAFATCP